MTAIVQETDAARINAVCNHPAVRRWVLVPSAEAVDLTDFMARPGNLVLMNEAGTGGIAFERHEPGVYEAHTQFLPEARGRSALAEVQAMLAHMFLGTDAMEIVTRCPVHNRPAEALARAVGGTLEFERPAAWQTEAGPVAVRFYALRYPDWARRAEDLPAVGAWFHDRLEAETERLGGTEDLHDEDPAHDRYVGAAVAMILAGQVGKGVVLYNRWARLAGYEPIAVLSADPPILDIRTHVLRVEAADFEVLECR